MPETDREIVLRLARETLNTHYLTVAEKDKIVAALAQVSTFSVQELTEAASAAGIVCTKLQLMRLRNELLARRMGELMRASCEGAANG